MTVPIERTRRSEDGATATHDQGEDLVFKIASEPWEFEQIHRLNYRTFVEEIPQHPVNPDGALVDKFHAENTYMICLRGRQLVGMICVRDKRPFSLDLKLSNLDDYLPPARKHCEYRLLAVLPEYRKGRVLVGLVAELVRYCLAQGYDLALISGTTRQQKLYRHLGFIPFGPLVGSGDAVFQPMYLTPEQAAAHIFPLMPEAVVPSPANGSTAEAAPPTAGGSPAEPVNLLPGPVAIPPEVAAALAEPPVSHRAEVFAEHLAEIKTRLRALVNAPVVEILMGSGTLANDAIAGQLALLEQPGVVLSNGEFGDRLLDHARRSRLDFAAVRFPWGELLDWAAVERALAAEPAPRWIWAVHCETSTGVLNDLATLKALAAAHGARLCLDGISSIGTVPVNLSGVFLASGVSGKGLAAFPGLSMVFSDHPFVAAPDRLPRYLDLGLYSASEGVPFTLSSNLLAALRRALERAVDEEHLRAIADLSRWLRTELEARGFRIVAPAAHAAPAVLTIALPPEQDSNRVGAELRAAGYLLSYQSRYLLERNWVQICLMGAWQRDQLAPLLALLERVVRPENGRDQAGPSR